MKVRAFRYQISPWLLASGIVCLAIMTLALATSFLEGVPSSPLWWTAFGIIAGLLVLTIWVTVVLRRAGPIEVRLTDAWVEVPDGALGTRPLRLPYESLRAIRIMTRPSALRRSRPKELLYLLREDQDARFLLLMSDLFSQYDAYLECRGALCEAARAAHPEVRVELDGELLEDLGRLHIERH